MYAASPNIGFPPESFLPVGVSRASASISVMRLPLIAFGSSPTSVINATVAAAIRSRRSVFKRKSKSDSMSLLSTPLTPLVTSPALTPNSLSFSFPLATRN